MTRRLLPLAALLCALPATGAELQLSQPVIHALTQMDEVASTETLNALLDTPVESLSSIALDRWIDLGVELRAIGALPAYCPPAPGACGEGAAPHDTLVALLELLRGVPSTPQDQLRLRAAVEALGATRSRLASDVELLVPLLSSGTRDLRVTVARALRDVCSPSALAPLSAHFEVEPNPRVRTVILDALRALQQCR